MTILATVLAVTAALAASPLLSSLIGRPPVKDRETESLRLPARCHSCRAPIASRDRIPLVSFFRRKGRCRACGARIPRWEIILEVVTPLVCALMAVRLGAIWTLPAHLVLVLMLVPIVFIDLAIHRIPDRILFPGEVLAAALLVGGSFLDGVGDRLPRAGLCGIGAFAFVFVLWFVYPAGMGYGDVKLAFPLGLFLGWHSVGHAVWGFFGAFAMNALAGLALIVARRRGFKDELPFGPALAIATVAAILLSPVRP